MSRAETLMAEYAPMPAAPGEAAAWWHELLDEAGGDVDVDIRFETWLDADPAHADAFRRVATGWETAGAAAGRPPILARRRRALGAGRGRIRTPVALAAGIGLAAAVALTAGAVWRHGEGLAPEPVAPIIVQAPVSEGEYATATGQRSTVILDDGSRIELNTATRVAVSMEADARRVRLIEGQALFDVARDPERAFMVEAGGQRITALGTVFDVRVGSEDGVQVTMLNGRTRIEPAETRASPRRAEARQVEISAGEQLIASAVAPALTRAVDAERVTSWRQGRIIFEDETLAEAILEMNRYARRAIVLEDAELSALKVSGVFTAGRSDGFVEALLGAYPVEVLEESETHIRLAGRGPAQ